MVTDSLSWPVFDADDHLYETTEALTKHLPDRYEGVIDYVDVRGRHISPFREEDLGALAELIGEDGVQR